MDHGLELFIPILEILEIEVCNIFQNPGNIGKRIFLIQSYPGNIGNLIFPIFPYPGNIGNVSLQHSPESWKYSPNPKPNPKSLFLINIYPCSAPDRPEATEVGTPPLFLCAGAVLESPRLAKGPSVDAKSPRLSRDAPPNGDPGVPKVSPKTA